jgi:UPF0755 protein
MSTTDPEVKLDSPPPPSPPESPPKSPPPEPAGSPPPIRLGRRLLIRLVLVLLLSAGVDVWTQLHAPLKLSQTQTVDVVLGSRFHGLLDELRERGILASSRQELYLWVYARVRGEAALIKAGEYALQPGLTSIDLLTLLLSGKTVLHEVRLVEGWRFGQAIAAIRLNADIAQTQKDADGKALMAAIGRPGVDPEGRLFPDTYRFPKGTSDVSLLKQAALALDRHLASEWAERAQNLPYDSPDQALVMASLIEKETAAPEERAKIAGVFVRRLQQGMRLQTDPTVIYGLGSAYDGNIRSRDLVTDTPYNTYTRDGLPPTPICLPGRESIHAAMHPEEGTALYFVSRGDGTHQFSTTLDEHNAAVRRYQLGGATRNGSR